MPSAVNGIDVDAFRAMTEAVRADSARGIVRFRVNSRWTGQTRSETVVQDYQIGGERIPRRFKIVADELTGLMGQDSAPNPQELLMTALNACMLIGYTTHAALQGIALTLLEIRTEGELDLRGLLGLDPNIQPGYARLDYTVRISGNATPEAFEAIHRMVMRTSPNYLNLSQPIEMIGRLEIV